MQLVSCLEDGYSLKDALYLLMGLYPVFGDMEKELKSGKNAIAMIAEFLPGERYQEAFLFIVQFSSLETALKASLSLGSYWQQFYQRMVKQLAYPVFLILTMMVFSLVMSFGLIPSLTMLESSFVMTENSRQGFLQVLMFLPYGMLVILLILVFAILWLYQDVRTCHLPHLRVWLRVPLAGKLLRLYYSMKFAGYFQAVASYASGLREAVTLMKKQLKKSDLMVIIYPLARALENGMSLSDALLDMPFFDTGLKRYIIFLSAANRPFSHLESYLQQAASALEHTVSRLSKTMVMIIYSCCGVFIIGLYIGMMMPMMNLISQL